LHASIECYDETTALFEDEALLNAVAAVNADIEDNAVCTAEDTCSVDVDDLNSAGDFMAACGDVGGRMVKVSAKVSCSSTASSGFEFQYMDLIDCVAPKCNDDNLKSDIDDSIRSTASLLESRTGATCSYETMDFTAEEVGGEGTGGTSGAFLPSPTIIYASLIPAVSVLCVV
jgi:hypothetical protein